MEEAAHTICLCVSGDDVRVNADGQEKKHRGREGENRGKLELVGTLGPRVAFLSSLESGK